MQKSREILIFAPKKKAGKTKQRSNLPCQDVTVLEMNLIPRYHKEKPNIFAMKKFQENISKTWTEIKLKYHFKESITLSYEQQSVDETHYNVTLFTEPSITDKTQEVHPITMQLISLKFTRGPSIKIDRPLLFSSGFAINTTTHS